MGMKENLVICDFVTLLFVTFTKFSEIDVPENVGIDNKWLVVCQPILKSCQAVL